MLWNTMPFTELQGQGHKMDNIDNIIMKVLYLRNMLIKYEIACIDGKLQQCCQMSSFLLISSCYSENLGAKSFWILYDLSKNINSVKTSVRAFPLFFGCSQMVALFQAMLKFADRQTYNSVKPAIQSGATWHTIRKFIARKV